MGGQRSPYGGQRPSYGGSKVTLWALWGPISPYGTYRIQHRSMGSKLNLWGQSSIYGVKAHPMGSKVTHEVKGHPMGGQRSSNGGQRSPYGVLYHPMGSIGSNAVLWGQTPFYGVKRHPMGSEVTHGVKGHPMGGQRSPCSPLGSSIARRISCPTSEALRPRSRFSQKSCGGR